MAISSEGIIMSHGAENEEFENLQEIPEIGGTPEKLDVTVLKDTCKKYINGIKDYGDLAFKFLYDNSSDTADYRVLRAYEESGETVQFKVEFPDGTAFGFSGQVSTKINSAGVNAPLTFTATIALSTDITVTHPVG